MTREQEIAFWIDAAARKDREGNTAVAITFRNIAWLLERAENWQTFIRAQNLEIPAK